MITFVYNPIDKMVEAVRNLYPDVSAEIQFNPEIDAPGATELPKDGSIPLIEINSELSFSEAVETMAHELAHVAAGTTEHNEKWKKASDAILGEFERIVTMQINQYAPSK